MSGAGQFPDAAYAETVLAVNFADAQKYFAEAMIDLYRAHLAMLTEQADHFPGPSMRIAEGAGFTRRRKPESRLF